MTNRATQLIIIFIAFISHTCSCQNSHLIDCEIDVLQNMIDSVPLAVVIAQNTETAPYSNLYRVQRLMPNSLFSDPKEIEFLSDASHPNFDKNEFKKINSECWLFLLNHSDYDWETNLFLYYLFEKDALFLIGMKQNEWKKRYKKLEYEEWREYFEKQ